MVRPVASPIASPEEASGDKDSLEWRWSGYFSLHTVSDQSLQIRGAGSNRNAFCILPIDIADQGWSRVCTFANQESKAPYRIENNCSKCSITYRQKDAKEGLDAYILHPGEQIPFAWDDPMGVHRLCIGILLEGAAYMRLPPVFVEDCLGNSLLVVFASSHGQFASVRSPA